MLVLHKNSYCWKVFEASAKHTRSKLYPTGKEILNYMCTWLKRQWTFNAWAIIVSAWERKIEFVCVSLMLNAWDLRALCRFFFINKGITMCYTCSFVSIEQGQISHTTHLRRNSDRRHKNLVKCRHGWWRISDRGHGYPPLTGPLNHLNATFLGNSCLPLVRCSAIANLDVGSII